MLLEGRIETTTYLEIFCLLVTFGLDTTASCDASTTGLATSAQPSAQREPPTRPTNHF